MVMDKDGDNIRDKKLETECVWGYTEKNRKGMEPHEEA